MIGKFLTRILGGSVATRPYSELDPKVKPLVDRMNATGVISTVASCQGHAAYGLPPYIYFKSSVAVAASIERALRDPAACQNFGLKNHWVVEGRFNEGYELTFLMYSPCYYRKSFSDISFLYFLFFRSRVDAELLSLTRVIEEVAVSEVRDGNEPQIATSSN